MAILSKIRERSLFLILVIGLALFAFVLDPSTLSDYFNSSKVNEVGEVNGEAISRQEFAEALESYKTQTGNRVSEMQAAKTVWNNLLRQKIYENQLEEAGITVGEEDILNAVYDAPSIQADPRFQSSGIFDKNKLKEHLATIKAEDNPEWKAWQNYMASLKRNIQKTTYDNLVGAGLGASLKEGETQYMNENTKLTADYVFLPFTSVADSLITLKTSDVKAYIDKNSSQFQVEESRDIKFVKFDIKPTTEDEEALKEEVSKVIEDREEYSKVTKGNVTIKGLKNATDYKTFLDENKSDTSLNENVQFKVQVPQAIADAVFNGQEGDVFGPYSDNGFLKVSKITEVLKVSDSVRSSHIIIPFLGSQAATEETVKTEEAAKKSADSIYNLVKSNKAKFAEVANEINTDGTKGKDGDINWVRYNTAFSPNFDKDFASFIFGNKEGDVEVVKTKFGYHIIRIDAQTEPISAVKLATFSRKVEASEATENTIFQNAEQFALEISEGKNYDELVKAKELASLPAVGLKALDENIPSLGNERQIINWAFEKDLEVGDYKRFDVDGGYVVAVLTNKTSKGLMSAEKAAVSVRPILLNEKKAELLKGKLKSGTLADIAKETKQTVKKAVDVNLKSPTISGIGFEPKVVGAMLNAKENELYKPIVGDRGVYAFVVSNKTPPTALPNYDTFRKRLATERKNQTFQMYEAIKKASEIEDNINNFYGIQ